MKFFNFFKRKSRLGTLKGDVELITFDFDFTEYMLKDFDEKIDENDPGTGWDWIRLLFDDLINNEKYFEISVYQYNHRNKSYTYISELIKEYYTYTFDNTYIFLKIKKEYDFLKIILEKGYKCYKTGKITTNQSNDIF